MTSDGSEIPNASQTPYWLQKVKETQNPSKFREEWFPVAKDMPITNSLLFSPKNSTKLGVAGVSLTKNSKGAKRGGLRP
jgi:hypothetical protein